ncbi:MAG TPA: NAD-dependent succinate-semialdehyde dehydrogenase [Egibacteraceae bacterium]|nr:NAD-dependent succinate-semialdehyde dehydrogenase [Egibacteraceae bacterium]
MTTIPIDLKVPTDLFIGGQWRSGESGETFPVQDPATGETIAEVANGTPDDGLAAVAAAERAFEPWAATAPRERGEVLRRAWELMTERADALAELIVREMGKALADAKGEVAYAAEFFRWYAEEAVRNQGTIVTSPKGDKRILVVHQPIGVSLLITPWNFPAAMATRKIGPALAAGCPVILKPASDTPLTALAIAALLAEAGVPDGVVNVVPSRQSSAFSTALLADPRVRKLSFTGSTEVGRSLLELAAHQVIDCSMELGGNAPFVVLDDADVDAAVEGAMVAKMRNGGEACTAANRFYVHEAVADEFTSKFTDAMQAVRMGSGLDPDTQLGPLINEGARSDVAGLVDGALSAGAKAATGGSVPDGRGWFYPATVLDDVPPDAEILTQEIFGPVAPVVRVSSDEEAIDLANDTEYGLVSYLYTRDLQRGLRVAEALEAGMVGLNKGLISDPAAPFGGVKQSGIGREGGAEGMHEFMESKYIATDW